MDSVIFWGNTVQRSATRTGNIVNYTWSPTAGLSGPSTLNPKATPTQNTIYKLTIVDANGCQSENAINISVLFDIFIANGFTPNDDALNHIFRIPFGTSFSLKQFSVFDRCGNEVFKQQTQVRDGMENTTALTHLVERMHI